MHPVLSSRPPVWRAVSGDMWLLFFILTGLRGNPFWPKWYNFTSLLISFPSWRLKVRAQTGPPEAQRAQPSDRRAGGVGGRRARQERGLRSPHGAKKKQLGTPALREFSGSKVGEQSSFKSEFCFLTPRQPLVSVLATALSCRHLQHGAERKQRAVPEGAHGVLPSSRSHCP